MHHDPVLMNDWHVVAWSADLPAGAVKRARILGEDLVVWRAADGQVMAWQDLCLHRGTRLSLGRVDGATIVCPYHGWTYGTDGRCTHIPAHPNQQPPTKAVARTYHAVECQGAIWVSVGTPTHAAPPLDRWLTEAFDPAFRLVPAGPYTVSASAPRVVENFLDVAHFPFVHDGFLGDPSHAEIDDYAVMTDDTDGVVAENIRVWQPNPDGSGVGRSVAYTYKVFRPLVAYFVKLAQAQFSILLTVTPVEPTVSEAWMWIGMNYGFEMSDAEIAGFQDVIFAQDLPIVESQRPELLPLDLQAELHLKSDRTAIAYRQWLRALGVTVGTA